MHKLKLGELSLGSAEVLTREQLKKVLGGQQQQTTGTCTGLNADGGNIHNLTKAEASNGQYVHWCCDSCDSASWYCPDSEYC